MGGNAKYRSHTAVIRNTNSESGVQAMRDSSGNLIRIPESERVVGRNNRTGANRANARERMLNNQAIQEVRDLAKIVRTVGNGRVGNITASQQANMSLENVKKSNDALMQLATLANQIEPGKVDALFGGSYSLGEIRKATKEVERILGVKLQ